MKRLILTDPHDVVPFILRLTLGLIIFPHGMQKMAGWFGGPGFEGALGFLKNVSGSEFTALLVILAESAGSIALIFGFFGRFMAFSIALVMLGAIYFVHWPNGFFMNWTGQQAGEGFEFHLLALGIAIAIMVRGSGKWSLDAVMQRAFTEKDRNPRREKVLDPA